MLRVVEVSACGARHLVWLPFCWAATLSRSKYTPSLPPSISLFVLHDCPFSSFKIDSGECPHAGQRFPRSPIAPYGVATTQTVFSQQLSGIVHHEPARHKLASCWTRRVSGSIRAGSAFGLVRGERRFCRAYSLSRSTQNVSLIRGLACLQDDSRYTNGKAASIPPSISDKVCSFYSCSFH